MSLSICSHCDKNSCISKVSIFENLDCDEVVKVVMKIKHKSFEKGELIFREGTPSDVLYFVNTGKIKLCKYTKDGKEQILHILSEGDFFGEFELLRSSVYKFDAKAIEKTAICILTKEEMRDIIMHNPEIGIKLLESVGNRLASAEALVQNLATNDVDSRVAYLIHELIEKYGMMKQGKLTIKLPISREEMANYIGVTRETISRKLKKFEDEELIRLVGTKTIIIRDLKGIEEYI